MSFLCLGVLTLGAFNFFVIEAGGFKFWVLGLLVAAFQQLEWCISCRLPLIMLYSYFLHSIETGGLEPVLIH